MTKFVHIVQVHPIVQGILQTHKVKEEFEFDEQWKAETCVEWMNKDYELHNPELRAVYLGCVNDATGELV